MMYTAAALAMILPLMDLHCGKSTCKVDDLVKKADVNGLATAVELKKVTSKVSNFATSGELNPLAKEATLKTAAGKVNKIHQRLPDFANAGAANTYDASKDALVVKKDLDDAINGLNIPTSIATPANVTNAQTDIKRHVTAEIGTAVKVGTSGGIAGHNQLTTVAGDVTSVLTAVTTSGTANAVGTSGGIAGHNELATVNGIVDELKTDLITGGTLGSTTKEKIALLTQRLPAYRTTGGTTTYVESLDALVVKQDLDVAKKAITDAITNQVAEKTELAKVVKDLITGGGGSTKEAIAKLATKSEVAGLTAPKKYLTLTLDITKPAATMKYNITASQQYQCESSSIQETSTEYVLCCDNSSAMKAFFGSYTADTANPKSAHLNATRICQTSQPATGQKNQMCDIDQFKLLSSSAADFSIITPIAGFGAYQPRTIVNVAAAASAPTKVWTNIEC